MDDVDMTEKRFRYKIRLSEKSFPIMQGHMHRYVWMKIYVAKLPRTRKNMMFNIRRRFRYKCVELRF